MALYHKWDVKNGFAYVLQFFPLISDDLGGVRNVAAAQLKSKVPLIERPVLKMNMSTYGVQKVGEHNFGEYRLNVIVIHDISI